MIYLKLISGAVYGLCAVLALCARDEPAQPVTLSIIPHFVPYASGGNALIVRFTIAPKWHLYWSNPGDSGVTETLRITLPEGWKAQPVVFPRPQILGTTQERNYGYESSLDLIVPVQAPTGALPHTISVTASIAWMACKGACVMGKSELALTVATEAKVPVAAAVVRAYPSSLPSGYSVRIEGSPLALVITAPATRAGAGAIQFIPDASAGIEFLGGTGPFLLARSGEAMSMRAAIAVHPKDAVDGSPRVRGLLLTGERESDPAYQIDLAAPDVPASGR